MPFLERVSRGRVVDLRGYRLAAAPDRVSASGSGSGVGTLTLPSGGDGADPTGHASQNRPSAERLSPDSTVHGWLRPRRRRRADPGERPHQASCSGFLAGALLLVALACSPRRHQAESDSAVAGHSTGSSSRPAGPSRCSTPSPRRATTGDGAPHQDRYNAESWTEKAIFAGLPRRDEPNNPATPRSSEACGRDDSYTARAPVLALFVTSDLARRQLPPRQEHPEARRLLEAAAPHPHRNRPTTINEAQTTSTPTEPSWPTRLVAPAVARRGTLLLGSSCPRAYHPADPQDGRGPRRDHRRRSRRRSKPQARQLRPAGPRPRPERRIISAPQVNVAVLGVFPHSEARRLRRRYEGRPISLAGRDVHG